MKKTKMGFCLSLFQYPESPRDCKKRRRREGRPALCDQATDFWSGPGGRFTAHCTPRVCRRQGGKSEGARPVVNDAPYNINHRAVDAPRNLHVALPRSKAKTSKPRTPRYGQPSAAPVPIV